MPAALSISTNLISLQVAFLGAFFEGHRAGQVRADPVGLHGHLDAGATRPHVREDGRESRRDVRGKLVDRDLGDVLIGPAGRHRRQQDRLQLAVDVFRVADDRTLFLQSGLFLDFRSAAAVREVLDAEFFDERVHRVFDILVASLRLALSFSVGEAGDRGQRLELFLVRALEAIMELISSQPSPPTTRNPHRMAASPQPPRVISPAGIRQGFKRPPPDRGRRREHVKDAQLLVLRTR